MMSDTNQTITEAPPQLKSLDMVSDLLDSRFRIPGTDIRFGVDFLVGLFPYAGDVLSFGMSGLLIIAMVRHGASGMLLAKMLGNIFLDTTVGSIPIIGDIFDLQYKANRRNYELLKEHYHEGEHKGSIWPILIFVFVLLFAMFILMIWLVWKIADWTFGLILG